MIPKYDSIIVSLDSGQKTSDSGIFIVSKNDHTMNGTVVAVGEGTVLKSGKIHPLSVKVGDRVLMLAETLSTEGTKISYEGEEVALIRERDVLGILESEDE